LVADLREEQARKRQKVINKGNNKGRGQPAAGGGSVAHRKPTLLQKLLAKEVRVERSLLLQAFRVMVREMMPAEDSEGGAEGGEEEGAGGHRPEAAEGGASTGAGAGMLGPVREAPMLGVTAAAALAPASALVAPVGQ
jgi:hypothetical protein